MAMIRTAAISEVLPSAQEMEHMHAVYREGGARHKMAPDIVYSEDSCPHSGCGFHLQAIDFRLESYGPAVHDPLVRSWWADVGFAGSCPKCDRWIHFTIREERALSPTEAGSFPNLPDDWHQKALIL